MWLTGERCEGDGNRNGVYFASKHGLKYFLTDCKKNEDIFSLRKVCHQKQIKKETYVYVHNHTCIDIHMHFFYIMYATDPCHTECCLQTSGIGITWNLVKNAKSQAPPQHFNKIPK